MSLADFCAVPKFVKQRSHKWGHTEPEPLLRKLYGLNGDGPEEYTDEDQKIYRDLKRTYATYARGVPSKETTFSRKEELDLLKAVAKLKSCMAKGWLDPFFPRRPPTKITSTSSSGDSSASGRMTTPQGT